MTRLQLWIVFGLRRRERSLGLACLSRRFALGRAALREVELVACRTRAEDEAEEHPDHQHAGDEDDVLAGHFASLTPASRSRLRVAISAMSLSCRIHRNSTNNAATTHIAAYA